MTAPTPCLDARRLGLRFAGGVEALADIDLRVERGELVSVVGPSGCGKSTLLRLVAGLIAPSAGDLRVDARGRAFVFQEPALLPWRSVRANVGLPLELAGRPRAEIDAATDAALALVGLAEFAARGPAELSGGMKMRASLARALVTGPELLLLDEPFGALDELTRERLCDELLRLHARDRWSALAVTHSVAEAVLLGDRVVVLSPRPGRVVADLRVDLPRPRTAAIQREPEFAALAGRVRDLLRGGA